MGATNTTKTTLWSVHKGDTFTLEVPRWLYDSFWWWECVQSTELPMQHVHIFVVTVLQKACLKKN